MSQQTHNLYCAKAKKNLKKPPIMNQAAIMKFLGLTVAIAAGIVLADQIKAKLL